jgi:hypothetical protein
VDFWQEKFHDFLWEQITNQLEAQGLGEKTEDILESDSYTSYHGIGKALWVFYSELCGILPSCFSTNRMLSLLS